MPRNPSNNYGLPPVRPLPEGATVPPPVTWSPPTPQPGAGAAQVTSQFARPPRPSGNGSVRNGRVASSPTHAAARRQATPSNLPLTYALQEWARTGPQSERICRGIAVDRIRQAQSQHLPLLDLSSLTLTSLPEGLHHMQSVVSLNLTDNTLRDLPRMPPNLRNLDLSHNEFFELPMLLHGLQLLNIEGNPLPRALPTHGLPIARFRTHADAVVSGQQPTEAGNLGLFNRVIDSLEGGTRADAPRQPVAPNPPTGTAQDGIGTEAVSEMFDTSDPAWYAVSQPNTQAADAMVNLNGPALYETSQPTSDVLSDSGNRTPLSSSPAALADIMMQWHPAGSFEGPEVAARWQQIAREEHAPVFAGFLQDLKDAADYKSDALRPAFQKNVGEIMTEVLNSDAFRMTCFAIALDLTDTCQDGTALGLNNMSLALIDHEAQAGRYTPAQLHDKGCNLFRLGVIDKIASKKIVELEKIYANDPTFDNQVDPVEVRLAYQTKLAARFNLQGVVSDMLYFPDSKLTEGDLTAAISEIHRQEAAGGHVAFLAEWSPWQKAMQRKHPEAFQRYEANRDEDRDWLACKPATMKDGAYMAALSAQKQHEAASLIRFTTRHTWQFMDEQAMSNA